LRRKSRLGLGKLETPQPQIQICTPELKDSLADAFPFHNQQSTIVTGTLRAMCHRHGHIAAQAEQ